MRPSFVHLLELGRLRDNFELSRLESVGKNVKTFLGSEIVKTARRGASPQVVFVRAISFSAEIATKSGAESALRSALGELERTFLLPGSAYDQPNHIRLGVGGGAAVNLQVGLERVAKALQNWDHQPC